MCKVVVADDHPLFRQAMQLAIAGLGQPHDVPVVLEASSIEEVRHLASAEQGIDLVLLDLRMPGMDGLAGLMALRREFPHLPVAIVSASDERKVIREAMALGATGFIPKTLPRGEIEDALERMLRGESYLPLGFEDETVAEDGEARSRAERIGSLTPQQLKVLQLVAQGKPNKIIAYELDIAETTVKAHITVILRKLGVYSRTQAVLVARDFFGAGAA
jgi:DNA-binding NarL/FixJ family response regulator